MAKNELLPFAGGEDANVLPTNQWEALTDILENGFQSGIARSEQVNRVLSQGAVASYVLGQLIVDQLNKDATLNKDTLYQNLVSALQENSKDVCLPLSGGNVTGNLTVQGKNVVRSVNGTNADANGNVTIAVSNGTVSLKTTLTHKTSDSGKGTKTVSGLTVNKPVYIGISTTSGSTYGHVYSGTALTGSSSSHTGSGGLNVGYDSTSWCAVIPTSTSISLLLYNNSAGTATVVVYQ